MGNSKSKDIEQKPQIEKRHITIFKCNDHPITGKSIFYVIYNISLSYIIGIINYKENIIKSFKKLIYIHSCYNPDIIIVQIPHGYCSTFNTMNIVGEIDDDENVKIYQFNEYFQKYKITDNNIFWKNMEKSIDKSIFENNIFFIKHIRYEPYSGKADTFELDMVKYHQIHKIFLWEKKKFIDVVIINKNGLCI